MDIQSQRSDSTTAAGQELRTRQAAEQYLAVAVRVHRLRRDLALAERELKHADREWSRLIGEDRAAS